MGEVGWGRWDEGGRMGEVGWGKWGGKGGLGEVGEVSGVKKVEWLCKLFVVAEKKFVCCC